MIAAPQHTPDSDGGPLAAYQARLAAATLTTDPAQKRAAEVLQRLWQALEPAPKRSLLGRWLGGSAPIPKGIYLYGPVGRGKTMLMDLLFETAREPRKRRVHFAAFMIETHARLHALRAGSAADRAVEALADEIADAVRLLCFDEFQVTDIADAMILGRLFDALFARGLVVVATSNTAPDQLYRDGLQRALFLPFVKLLKEHVEVVEVGGPTDHRLGRLTGREVYLVPADPAADAELGRIFSDLAAGASPHAVIIPVEGGRHLTVARAGPGVAWFEAAELIGEAVSAADYLALTAHFDAIILSRIPRLAPEQRNEARRLITLVDVLYDAGVRLIASAEAEPEALYPAGLHAEEFARTASRLNEMRSADWVERAEGRTRVPRACRA